jgi:hypothetical protein
LTYSHIGLKGIGEAFDDERIRGYIAWGKFVPVKDIDVSCLVSLDEGTDLASMLVKQVDKRKISEIISDVNQSVRKIKEKKDGTHAK